MICALEHFRVYLLGRKFQLRTDHQALAWLYSKEPKASARISGWFAALMEYPIVIGYVRGTETRLRMRCLDSNRPQSTVKFLSDLSKKSPVVCVPYLGS